jgi:hypothetical protein
MSENVSKESVPKVRNGVKNAILDKIDSLKIAVMCRKKNAANVRKDQIHAIAVLPENPKHPCAMMNCINYGIAIHG